MSRGESIDGRKLPASYARHSGVIAFHLDLRRQERGLVRNHPGSLASHHYLVPYIALGSTGNRDFDYQVRLNGLIFYRRQFVEPRPRQETRHVTDLSVAGLARQINLVAPAG